MTATPLQISQDETRTHWPAWSHATAEQPPFRSHLAAAQWAEDHDEDLSGSDDWDGDEE